MKFTYIGDADKEVDGEIIEMSPPKSTTVLGVTFELNGDPQEVPDNLVRKFQGMKIFEQVRETETEDKTKTRGRPKKDS